MLTVIRNADIFYRFLIAYRKHNAQCPTYTTSRTCKTTGRVTEFTRQKGVITESVKTTFYMVLREYVESYVSVARDMPAGLYEDADPPSLLTNSLRLAKVCDCSDRTVRNHLRQLRDLGVVRTKFHGRKHNYELWINTEFLYGGEAEQAAQKSFFRPETALQSTNKKIFPPNNIYREINEIENGKVDMFIKHGERKNDGEKGRTDNLEGPREPSKDNTERLQAGGGLAARKSEIVAENERKRLERAAKVLDERTLKGPMELEPKFYNLVVEFWIYAMKILYPNRSFTKQQREKAQIAISAGVYKDFKEQRSDREWIDFQVHQITKLDKAGKYYDRHPEQWAPDPYAISVPGRGYFDAENKYGFAIIERWVDNEKKQKARNKESRDIFKEAQLNKAQALLRMARIDFEKFNASQPLRKLTGHFTDITQIYRFYHDKLHKIGTDYTDMLNEQFIDQKATNFQPPKYNQAKRVRRNAHNFKNVLTPAAGIMAENWMEGDGD